MIWIDSKNILTCLNNVAGKVYLESNTVTAISILFKFQIITCIFKWNRI